jgi:hypothetical protein
VMVICEVVVEEIPRGHGRKKFNLGRTRSASRALESPGCIFRGHPKLVTKQNSYTGVPLNVMLHCTLSNELATEKRSLFTRLLLHDILSKPY